MWIVLRLITLTQAYFESHIFSSPYHEYEISIRVELTHQPSRLSSRTIRSVPSTRGTPPKLFNAYHIEEPQDGQRHQTFRTTMTKTSRQAWVVKVVGNMN